MNRIDATKMCHFPTFSPSICGHKIRGHGRGGGGNMSISDQSMNFVLFFFRIKANGIDQTRCQKYKNFQSISPQFWNLSNQIRARPRPQPPAPSRSGDPGRIRRCVSSREELPTRRLSWSVWRPSTRIWNIGRGARQHPASHRQQLPATQITPTIKPSRPCPPSSSTSKSKKVNPSPISSPVSMDVSMDVSMGYWNSFEMLLIELI